VEKTLFETLRELLSSPSTFWSLTVFILALITLGVYIGASARYILGTRNIISQVVTKNDLDLALAQFVKALDGRFQSIPLCQERHQNIGERLKSLEQAVRSES